MRKQEDEVFSYQYELVAIFNNKWLIDSCVKHLPYIPVSFSTAPNRRQNRDRLSLFPRRDSFYKWMDALL